MWGGGRSRQGAEQFIQMNEGGKGADHRIYRDQMVGLGEGGVGCRSRQGAEQLIYVKRGEGASHQIAEKGQSS